MNQSFDYFIGLCIIHESNGLLGLEKV